MIRLKLLAVAAGTGRVAYVFFVGPDLKDWAVSEDAAASPGKAKKAARRWIKTLEPKVVVVPDLTRSMNKGPRTRDLVTGIAGMARRRNLICIEVPHGHEYANKYDEAAALSERYPEVAGWLPDKRLFYDKEPRNIVLFEALSIADQVVRCPAVRLARAMG